TLVDSLGKAIFGAVSFSGGVATVTATLDAAGSQTIMARDTTASSITGTSSALTVSAAAATHLLMMLEQSSPITWADTFGAPLMATWRRASTGTCRLRFKPTLARVR